MSAGIFYVSDRDTAVELPEHVLTVGARARPCVLLSPFLCPAALVQLPPVPERRMRDLVSYQVRSLFPGRPEDLLFGFVCLPPPHAKHLLVFAMSAVVAAEIRREHGSDALVPAALLAHAGLSRRRPEVVVSTPDAVIRMDTSRQAGPTLEVSPAEASRALALRGSATEAEADAHALARDALRRASRTARGLFVEPRSSLVAARVLLPLLVISTAAWRYLDGASSTRAAELASLRREARASEMEARELSTQQRQAAELEARVAKLSASRPPGAYGFLQEVAQALAPAVRLRDVTVSGATFELRGTAADAWAVVRAVGSRPGILTAQLLESVPDQTGGERFVIRGTHAIE